MASYIFLTTEGYTFQPDADSKVPDIENLQVMGFSAGGTEDQAFRNLLEECPYLAGTTFDEFFCYRLSQGYESTRRDFSLRGQS